MKTLNISELKNIISEEIKILNEGKKVDKWGQKAAPEKGKMHKLLNIPEDKKIEDVYKSGKKLAQDLIEKVGLKKAAGMINFAANINKDIDIFDKTQEYLSKQEEK